MKRYFSAAVLLLLTAASVSAQDIALSKILIEGEGWREVKEQVAFPTAASVTVRDFTYQVAARNSSPRILSEKTQGPIQRDGLTDPSCLALWTDNAQLVIGDAGGKYLWTARIEKDGKLSGFDAYYLLRVQRGAKVSGVQAMVVDAANLLYACTPLGVQVFDPTGRLCGVILPPAPGELKAISIGGERGDTLRVACGDKVYSRKVQVKELSKAK